MSRAVASVASTVAVATPAVSIAVPRSMASRTADHRLAELWEKRRAARAAGEKIEKKYSSLAALLPSWAKSGPEYVYSDGSAASRSCPWPAIKISKRELKKQPPLLPILVRPSPKTIDDEYRVNLRRLERAKAYELRHQALAELEDRLCRRRIEEERLGLHLIDIDASFDPMFEIEAEIAELAPTVHVAAALILLEAVHHPDINDPVLVLARQVLTALRPQLSGAVRADVDELLDNPDPLVHAMAFAIGRDADPMTTAA